MYDISKETMDYYNDSNSLNSYVNNVIGVVTSGGLVATAVTQSPQPPLSYENEDTNITNKTFVNIILSTDTTSPYIYINNTTNINNSFIDNLNNDLCDNGYHGGDEILSSYYFQTTVCLMYITIFLVALIGNGLVCFIVLSSPRMRTVTNYFIANLAVGDILMSLFCVPFSFVSILILHFWPFGAVLCHLVNYSQAVSVLVSAYTLVAISVDRYMAIMWPLRPRISKRYAKCIIAGVWGIALITALPIPIVSRLQQPVGWHEECGRYICQERWPTELHNYYYTLALMTLQFVIPFTVLIFTYTKIAIAVWGKRPPGEAENSRDQRMARSKRKVEIEDPCINFYKPIRVQVITDLPKGFPSGHWPMKDPIPRGPPSTEYQATISNVGGIIQRENLNNHAKCVNHCSHLIMASKFDKL